MPRVYDRTPRAQDDKNPLKNLLNYDALDVDIRNLAGVIRDAIEGVLDEVLGFIKDLTGIDLTNIFEGIDITNPGAILTAIVGGIGDAVASLEGSIVDVWGQLQNVGGLILQVIQGLEDTPLLDPLDLLGSIWFWVGGLWNTVLQGVSPQNPAIVSQDNRIAALEASLYQGTIPSRVDDFNDPALPKWGVIGAFPKIQAGSGYIAKSTAFRAGEFTSSMPDTGKYRVQAAAVDLGYGRSRLIVQADSAFSNLVVLELSRNNFFVDINLGPASSIDGTMTIKDSHTVATGGFKYADVLGVLVDESTNTFTALWNNSPVATWVDSTVSIGTGAPHRHLALCTNISANPTFPGCGWEVFSQADIT